MLDEYGTHGGSTMAEQALDAAFNQAAAGAAASTGEWAGLKTAAGEGRLRLEPDAAQQCAAACDAAIDKLSLAQNELMHADRLEGLGAWDSGKSLARTLGVKVRGDKNSAFSVIQTHIDILLEMQATFRSAAAAYTERERENAGALQGRP